MSEAKQFLAENGQRFRCDATADQAWRDAVSLGQLVSTNVITFADGSRLVCDPMACSIVATDTHYVTQSSS